MKTKKSLAKAGANPVQQLFTFIVFSAFTVALAQQVWLAAMQLSSNPNLSSFYLQFMTISLMPAAIFIAAYLLVRRKLSLQQRLFESTLLAVVSYTACMGINILINSITWALELHTHSIFSSFGVPTAIAVIVFVATLLYVLNLRKTGRW